MDHAATATSAAERTPDSLDAVPLEVEAKFHASARAFAQLWDADEVVGWPVTARQDVALRDVYWDTADGRLALARQTLRVRTQRAAPVGPDTAGTNPSDTLPRCTNKRAAPVGPDTAGTVPVGAPAVGAGSADSSAGAGSVSELTLKGPAVVQSVATATLSRSELTVPLPPEAVSGGPAQWASLPATRAVLEALRRAGVDDPAGALHPDLVLLNPRRELLLEHDGTAAALSLDEVQLEGSAYRRRYIEVELKHGSAEALETLARAIATQFHLRPARGGKVQAARRWLARLARQVT